MSDANFGIAITAKNKTQAGLKAAKRDLTGLTKQAARASTLSAGASQRATTDWGRSMVRTFSQVERAVSGVFGGGRGRGGIVGQMTALRTLASTLGEGFGGAAAEAGALEAGIAGVGMAATSTAAVVVGLAVGMTKLADGWGKGATQLGNMASIIGVSTKGLQEFAGAAERAGVDKSTAMGALGGLSQTLNDVAYNRNSDATEILHRLRIGVQRNSDGTANVDAMLPAIADAMQGQNSSGRRTMARYLGINPALIPVLAQGGGSLRGEMEDVGRVGAVVSDDDVALGRAITHRDVAAMQRVERGALVAQRTNATIVKGAGDMLIGAYGAITKPSGGGASGVGGSSGSTPAAGGTAVTVGGRAIQLTEKAITDLKKGFATEWGGRSADQGHGIIDTMLNRVASGHWGSSIADVLNAKYQFSDVNGPVAWKHGWRSVAGIPGSRVSKAASAFVDDWLKQRALGTESSVGDNLNYANPYFSSRRAREWIDPMDGPIFGSGTNIHKHGTVPELQQYRPGAFGVGTPEIPVKVEVTVKSDRPTTAKVAAGADPAVSYAFAAEH